MQKQSVKDQVEVRNKLNARASSRDNIGFSLTKDMSDSEIDKVMLSKLFQVRKELGLA
ncbi:hypothetical protein [Vibrio harveyi]|uniref:hypothetical protein n=1 Tax=Vibrio harveyi TaxID=669 RepID=UPI0028948DC4|nr:hypothetical protein [Vibrio harveyi]ELI0636368.1 hypothetical protein [Vibrio harveyi]